MNVIHVVSFFGNVTILLGYPLRSTPYALRPMRKRAKPKRRGTPKGKEQPGPSGTEYHLPTRPGPPITTGTCSPGPGGTVPT